MAPAGQGKDPARRLRFGAFELDALSEELFYRGTRLHVQEMPLKVLAVLLEHPGDLIRREEFFERLWPDDELGILDDNLNVAMHKLRVALGDEPSHPNYIETVPRKGYRFIGTVSDDRERAGPASEPEQRPASAEPRAPPADAEEARSGSRGMRMAGLAGVLAVVITGLGWLYFSDRAPEPLVVPETEPGPNTLAVLPFVNMSDDPEQEFFSDGLTEELLMTLAKLPDLRVISRTSVMRYKGSDLPLKEIAGKLGATHILEGSVRQSNGRLRITAQLIDAVTDHHLWAEAYDRNLEDIFAIQRDIATEIAAALDTSFAAVDPTPVPIDARPTEDLEAYQLYLQGRHLFHNYIQLAHEGPLPRAIEYYERAIEKDPGFARAWAAKGAAHALLLTTMYHPPVDFDETAELAKVAIRRALEFDPTVAEAHTARAKVQMSLTQWALAEDSLLQAMETEPGYPLARVFYGTLLVSVGKNEAAVEVLLKATELDPLNALTAHWLADALRNSGRLDASHKQAQRGVDLGMASSGIGVYIYHLLREEWNKAVEYLTEVAEMQGLDPLWVRPLVEAVRDAQRIPGAVEPMAKLGRKDPNFLPVFYYFDLDAPDLIFDGIEELLGQGRTTFAFWRMWEPQFTHLRNHPRFHEIAERAGLLDYWLERGWPDLCRPFDGGFVCD